METLTGLPAPPEWEDEALEWVYADDDGELQGPFETALLREWLATGSLSSLPVDGLNEPQWALAAKGKASSGGCLEAHGARGASKALVHAAPHFSRTALFSGRLLTDMRMVGIAGDSLEELRPVRDQIILTNRATR